MAEGGQEIAEEVGDGNILKVDSTNFLKLLKIIIDIGGPTLRHLLQKLATADRDDVQQFFEFLNIPSVRCELFQLRKNKRQEMICCICNGYIFLNELRDGQWKKLYEMLDKTNCNSERRLSLNKHCCVHVAVAGVLDNLDVSLMCLILTNLSDFNKDEPLMGMITTIRNYRNELSHLSITEIADDEFEFQCRDIRNTLRDLVNVCGDRKMLDQVFSQIDDVKRMKIAQQDRDKLQSFMEAYKMVLRMLKTFSTGPLGDFQQLQSLRSDENAMELIDELIKNMDNLLSLISSCLTPATNI